MTSNVLHGANPNTSPVGNATTLATTDPKLWFQAIEGSSRAGEPTNVPHLRPDTAARGFT